MTQRIFTTEFTFYKYPDSMAELIELGLVDLNRWRLMSKDEINTRYDGLCERYPTRRLFPFAKRDDNDDIACIEEEKEKKVQIIHDFSSSGWEQVEEYDDFWTWFEMAIRTMIDFYRLEEEIE
ncbi:hypothetical protein [Streptococcus ruminantium]|uniref:hypothetical protein n=1 Tax=Streptococcus ruminantium TaxID=1917441 RepID=UPI0012DC5E68|nr:hypothetical protein [Streptococcus ruminantium]